MAHPKIMAYEDIPLGHEESFDVSVTEDMILSFARLSGDFNPLHVDKEYGKASAYKKNVVHGMLLASFFSQLIGMYCPGRNSLYLSQTLKFKRPVFAGDTLTVRGQVIQKTDITRVITLKTEILKGHEIVVTGQAMVQVVGQNEGFYAGND